MKKALVFALMLIAISIPLLTFADSHGTPGATQTAERAEFKPIVPLPDVTSELTFSEYINQLFKLVISLSAILAVLVVIYGGFEYMASSAGVTKKNGMERIQGAVTGLLLLLSVTLILHVINPCILDINVLSENGPTACSPSLPTPPPTTDGAATDGGATPDGGAVTDGLRDTPTGACTRATAFTCGDNTPATPACYSATQHVERDYAEGCAAPTPQIGFICTDCRTPASTAPAQQPISLSNEELTRSGMTLGACAGATDENSSRYFCCTDAARTSCLPRTGATCAAETTTVTVCQTLIQ